MSKYLLYYVLWIYDLIIRVKGNVCGGHYDCGDDDIYDDDDYGMETV